VKSNKGQNILQRTNQSIGQPVYKWLFVYQELSARIDKLIQHLALSVVKRSGDTEALWHLQQYSSTTQMYNHISSTIIYCTCTSTHTHHTQPFYGPLGFCPGLPWWACTRKVKPIWIYWSKRVGGSGISWAICKSAPWPRHNHASITPLSFYRPDAIPAAQPTASKALVPQQLNFKQTATIMVVTAHITGTQTVESYWPGGTHMYPHPTWFIGPT